MVSGISKDNKGREKAHRKKRKEGRGGRKVGMHRERERGCWILLTFSSRLADHLSHILFSGLHNESVNSCNTNTTKVHKVTRNP